MIPHIIKVLSNNFVGFNYTGIYFKDDATTVSKPF